MEQHPGTDNYLTLYMTKCVAGTSFVINAIDGDGTIGAVVLPVIGTGGVVFSVPNTSGRYTQVLTLLLPHSRGANNFIPESKESHMSIRSYYKQTGYTIIKF